jgi:hypothetical protein
MFGRPPFHNAKSEEKQTNSTARAGTAASEYRRPFRNTKRRLLIGVGAQNSGLPDVDAKRSSRRLALVRACQRVV